MVKMFKLMLVLGILAIVASCITACSSTPASTTPSSTTTIDETAAIRAYADPATQTTLEGLSEGNLAKYTQYANAPFKDALTQEVFDKTVAQLQNQLGDFASITFSSTRVQDGYIIVHYRAKYAKGETGIKMVFDQEHQIAGQWFEP